jgi:hypothetical protein
VLNRLVVKVTRDGDYRTGLTIAEQTYRFAEQALGPEHPDTLGSVHNLAYLYQAQGRYGEAEPLVQRALTAREKVLGPEHPDTFTVQLNYTVTLVNLQQPERALQLLERLEPRLLALAALQLRTTRQEWIRRRFLAGQSTFQNVVLTLALRHPEDGFLDLAAQVMLRWKQIQGEEETFLARLVRRRGGQDAEVRALAAEIAALRRDLSHLVHQPEPDADVQRQKLNELEAKETRLAQISHEFNRHLQVRAANADDVRSYLPREGGALVELRQYYPFDFKTGEVGPPRWVALLLPASGAMSLHDLGPVAETWALWQELDRTGARETAAALYRTLFGTLDATLKGYETLYLAPDGFLTQVPFARLVTPQDQYWIQRQTLRQVTTGRHLIAGYDRDLDKPKGLLALGGVDYLKTLTAAPQVLHLATHGFYLADTQGVIDRPLVLSGLALAGANRGLQGQRGPDGEDGILYALKVQDLNLEDTELVTLSACDTGHGTLDASEGVYGLVRAFRIAGARNVMMSLWTLGDASAREFMGRFYRRWLGGSSPGDLAVALRDTQRSFIEDADPRLRDPRVWAPFVLVEARSP